MICKQTFLLLNFDFSEYMDYNDDGPNYDPRPGAFVARGAGTGVPFGYSRLAIVYSTD